MPGLLTGACGGRGVETLNAYKAVTAETDRKILLLYDLRVSEIQSCRYQILPRPL